MVGALDDAQLAPGAVRARSSVARMWWGRVSEPNGHHGHRRRACAVRRRVGRTHRPHLGEEGVPLGPALGPHGGGQPLPGGGPIMRRRNPSAAPSGSGTAIAWLPGDDPGHHGAHISGAS